jgi:hypothetical protein
MKSPTTLTELDLAEVERAVELVEQHLGEDVARPLRLLLMWSGSLLALLQEKHLSLKRLRRLLFGPRTERTCDVVAETNANANERERARGGRRAARRAAAVRVAVCRSRRAAPASSAGPRPDSRLGLYGLRASDRDPRSVQPRR